LSENVKKTKAIPLCIILQMPIVLAHDKEKERILFLSSERKLVQVFISSLLFGKDVHVMNQLDPIEELYNMYLEKEDTPRIVEVGDNDLDFVLDIEGPANPYMDL